MKRNNIILLPIFALSLLFALYGSVSLGAAAQPAAEAEWRSKVDQELLDSIDRRGADWPIEFIVRIQNEPRDSITAVGTKEERTTMVYTQLRQQAAGSQASLIKVLNAAGAETRSFYIVNAVYVRGAGSLVSTIAQRADVVHIHANPKVKLDIQAATSFPFIGTQAPNAPSTVEWGVEKIGAPLIWSAGITGTGVTIAGQDTGYHWEHPALKAQYRGWDGATADHNYNWHDAISGELNNNDFNSCGYNLTEPCDDISSTHGTHTMGTMIGEDGNNQIGVAPGADWIACRNMEEGYGTPATYIDCFEWFLAPTDLNGANPDPTKAPHVINNSWGCPPSEGCNTSNFDLMNTVVENLRAAGIVVVVSAGNSGSSCSSVSTPGAIFGGAFSVGATAIGDTIAGFSSRGPVLVDGSNRMKPNVTAPGVSVRSARGTNSYGSLSGTSMAGPHVAGAVGLLISAHPPIAGQVEAIESYLEETAEFIGIGDCGGDEVFNNTFGHGRINVNHAVQAVWDIDIIKTAPDSLLLLPGGQGDFTKTFTYSIVITKTGSHITFTDVTVTDTLPVGTTFVSANRPVSVTGNVLTFNIGELAPLETVDLEITVLGEGTPKTFTDFVFPAAEVTAHAVPVQTGNTATTTVNLSNNWLWLPMLVN